MLQNRGKGRIEHVMKTLGIEERKNEMCEKLSGGLKRRVELAKGMLHRPKLFLMDEPTTGLDPAARIDFWHAIESLRTEQGMTVVFTTHLLEEAEKCDRIAILHLGNKVAMDRPDALRRSAGEGVLTITTNHPEAVLLKLKESFALQPVLVQSQIRVSTPDAARWVAPIAESLGNLVDQIAVGRPSLEDVFVAKTAISFGIIEHDGSHPAGQCQGSGRDGSDGRFLMGSHLDARQPGMDTLFSTATSRHRRAWATDLVLASVRNGNARSLSFGRRKQLHDLFSSWNGRADSAVHGDLRHHFDH